tara:strand:+ start:10332 stop:10625 length:294 start_codon:yes stop_codon:yes gene_type:complete
MAPGDRKASPFHYGMGLLCSKDSPSDTPKEPIRHNRLPSPGKEMKPLTEDEIEKLFDIAVSEAWNSPSAYPSDIVPLMFARAIEAHHGIEDRQLPEA